MIYKFKLRQSYLFFLAAAIFFSCKQGSKPDVSKIDLEIKIERFDQDLYAGKNKPLIGTTSLLQKKYGIFYYDYINKVVGNGEIQGNEMLNLLYNDKAYSDLTKETDSVFNTLSVFEKELTQSFKYIRHYYPKVRIPRFIAYVSGFSYQNIMGEDYLGIGLDMFLGKNSKFYGAIVDSAPRYVSRRFSPEYVVPRTVETFVREELFPEPDGTRSLLAKMIHNGKILYYMDQVLDESIADSIKIGYTDRQLRWCETYKKEIWGYFLENNLLYETNLNKIQVFLGDGPFTPGVGVEKESAPKLGIWTGWQIVRSYMKNNPGTTLQSLMEETDPQVILNKARYKP
ncbi:MAG: gliding motility lipoprotein GldB [Pedobacter sp.]|nr:MAG: gliding motility lipoprotein GldB [Pedobacter sp.]